MVALQALQAPFNGVFAQRSLTNRDHRGREATHHVVAERIGDDGRGDNRLRTMV